MNQCAENGSPATTGRVHPPLASSELSFYRTAVLPARASVTAALRQLLWFMIAGTRGGGNRARIIEVLRERPHNAHQLAKVLGLDYRTIRHHLALLHKNGLITRPAGDEYAAPYFLSAALEANFAVFEEIRDKAAPKERLR